MATAPAKSLPSIADLAAMQAEQLLERAASLANIELQRSGFVPSPTEVQTINENSGEMRAEIMRINAEILRLELLRGRLITQLNMNCSLKAPVRRLPLELISEIFLHLADITIPHDRSRLIVRTVVCAWYTWWTAARCTPHLWTYIPSAYPTQTRGHSRPPAYPDYGLHAALSGGLPLHICHTVSDDDLLARFLEELRPHASRWQSIELQGYCSSFNSEKRVDLPSLEEARLQLEGPPEPGTLDFLADALALKHLDIEYVSSNLEFGSVSGLRLPCFPTLTHLSLGCDIEIPTDIIIPALRQCSATLTHLTLQTLIVISDAPAVTSTVDMTALSSIDLACNSHEILQHITAPVLDNVALRDVLETDGDPFASLLAFVSPSQHAPIYYRPHVSHLPQSTEITRLTVSGLESESRRDTFLPCLELLSGLRELIIDESVDNWHVVDEDVLVRLTCQQDIPPLLPKLTSFSFNSRRRRPPPSFKNALREMVMSREIPRICASQAVAAMTIDTDVKYERKIRT
ncbi:hypothetical protein BD626DRAFT_476502 [Schizophyllum amplum]|uniref:F-box domain-containing protein n=1 Tax=Schizophyllum amplum TaxID=97359 RepID=A0A550CZF5_9AGAR|nr:hypothetical protein BD626DRAFT_476502 [Auriculariopsis ampla]